MGYISLAEIDLQQSATLVTVRQAMLPGLGGVPRLFLDAGDKACWRLIEFFTANIRNRGTREVYGRVVRRFCNWCEKKAIPLHALTPFLVAAYIEELGTQLERPTVKLHLAAIRMLCDWLVVGQILAMNPASSVRGPKHIVRSGKTPVLLGDEARQLLESIDASAIGGLRDRALVAVMVYSFARVGAVCAMNVEDSRAIQFLPPSSMRIASITRSAHISSPWAIFGVSTNAPEIRGLNGRMAGVLIATVSNETHDAEARAANAGLIAASPDLLEACYMR